MDGIYEILHTLFSSPSDQNVLATIIHVDGSAYRKEGASMLIQGDGTQIGLLSSNCLEADLSGRMQEILTKMESETIVYDMRAVDDFSWGQGAGCNGSIHVLVEPIDQYLRVHLWKLKFYLDTGYRVTTIKKLTEVNTVSDYLFIADDQKPFGRWQGEDAAKAKRVITDIHQKQLKSGIHYCSEFSTKLYLHSYQPQPRLILFGAGPDAAPVATFAARTGFRVVVSDWRSNLCNHQNFPDAENFVIGFPKDALNQLQFTVNDSVLIMTHQFQRDKELLQELKEKSLKYLGILGPRMRTERLLDGQEIPSCIHSPAGLSIGAEGPYEIAVSIVAELIQQQRNGRPVQDVYR